MTKSKLPSKAKAGKTAHEKGMDLEQAIGAIERVILSANPNLSEKAFDIRFRNRIVISGVMHEIDVWVEVDLGNGYKSIFIFEARNWKKKIGKDHILIFSKKIIDANAQTGYFVAKSFTKYAIAAAQNDQRVRLLKADDNLNFGDWLNNFHSVYKDQSRSDAKFQIVVSPNPLRQHPPASFVMDNVPLTLNGNALDYRSYVDSIVSQMIEEHSATVPTHKMEEGEYVYEIEKEITFCNDRMIVDGFEVNRINVKLKYPLRVARPSVISKFDIESRGRVCSFEGVSMGAYGTSRVTVVERENSMVFLVNVGPPTT